MTGKGLNAAQVAVLLVSASYGIGFLFGSGELAVTHGMAGSLYGVATAGGMLLLAIFAARLWRRGMPIWDLFGQTYGERMKAAVALLSIVWMAGVLAAQIHGGIAALRLLGLEARPAFAVVLCGIFAFSRLQLRAASMAFAAALLVSAIVLMHALFAGSGGQVALQAPARFIEDLNTFAPASALAIALAIVTLVCTGADYHQFLLAARSPRSATLGCLFAGLLLCVLSCLPASIVVGLQLDGALAPELDPKQVIPWALARSIERLGVGPWLLAALSAAALGFGAAVLRAMADATRSSAPGAMAQGPWPALVSLAAGAALAAAGQGIVATMVSVNIVYIAAIGWTYCGLLAGRPPAAAAAAQSMLAGVAVATAVYGVHMSQGRQGEADLAALLLGAMASGSMILAATMRSAVRGAGR